MKRTTQLSFNHQLTFASGRPKRRRRWLFAGFALLLIAGGVGYVLWQRLSPMSVETATAPSDTRPNATAPEPTVAAPQPPPVVTVDVAYTVRPNDTLGEIFGQLNLDVAQLPAILGLPAVRDHFKPLQPGDELVFTLENGALHRINRRVSETEVISITRGANGFTADVAALPVVIKTARVRGTINSSRFVAGRVAGLSTEIIQQLANDVFGWDIDFALDVRPGDRFNVMYEQKFRGSDYLGDGRIIAAEFVNNGAVYRAVRYTSPDGKIDGYFTPDGESVRREFLRTPLDFTQVSAHLDTAGRPLIYDTMANHQGIDYPAPAGTAVKAAGDGRIEFVGVKGAYGNAVIIKHAGATSTLYAHLSGFARGLHAGQRVRQGEIVGYVGRTGAATAPHLHYEYRVDGSYTDPHAVESPAAAAIPAEYAADFRSKSAALLDGLKRPDDAVVTAALND